MPIKDWLHRLQPVQLYIVLTLSICYFIAQLIFSHITHALTLLMASYHMLCNIIALTGCILTIKHSKKAALSEEKRSTARQKDDKDTIEEQTLTRFERGQITLRNTFGWARIDILTMLIVFIILASFAFSLLVEALQTLIHIDHQDTMHLPIPVLILSSIGLVLNGLCYLLIGGYTMHQGSFLLITSGGDVILDRVISEEGNLKADERRLSKTKRDAPPPPMDNFYYQPKRQGIVEVFRDVSSTIFVIVCSVIVYVAEDEHTAKFIDPVISIMSCILLVSLSYPYMKESCLILLQTIPGSIDMEIFEKTLVTKFPEIVSYHDLHIWQLSANKYVSTVHITFRSPKLYCRVIDDVKGFFFDQGISIVTIQPEFLDEKLPASNECLVQCQNIECAAKACCQQSKSDLTDIVSLSPDGQKTEPKAHKTKSKGLKFSSLLSLRSLPNKANSTNNLSVSENAIDLKKSASDWQVDEDKTQGSAMRPAVSLTPDVLVEEKTGL